MYRGFRVKALNTRNLVSYEKAKASQEEKGYKIYEELKTYVLSDGIIDASKIQNDWFPLLDANVFISHSHADIKEVTLFAGLLEKYFGLKPFIDYYVWGYYQNILKLLLDINPNADWKTISYLSSNVHLMLSTALSMMIDKCEVLFFYDTPNSISARDVITKTNSAWIYHEIGISDIIRKKSPIEHRTKSNNLSMLKEASTFNFNIDLSHLEILDCDDIKEWISNFKSQTIISGFLGIPINPLDVLYKLKPIPNNFQH